MGLGDGVSDLRSYLSEWIEMPARLSEVDRRAYRDLLTLLDYFVLHADLSDLPEGAPVGNPIIPAFDQIAVKLEEIAVLIKGNGLLEWDARMTKWTVRGGDGSNL